MFGNRTEMNAEQTANAVESATPSLVEFLGAQMGQAFYEATSTGVFLNELGISGAESDVYGVSKSRFFDPNPFDPVTQNKEYKDYESKRKSAPTLSKEEWESSEFYREGMEYNDSMTIPRAAIQAQAYDRSKYRASVVEARDPGAIDTALGFGVQVIASLPDPINFLPIGRAFSMGSGAASKVFGAMAEGAIGNLAVSAVTRPYWDEAGIESDWKDYVMDTIIGGALGGAIGSIGVGFDKIKRSRQSVSSADMDTLGKAVEAVIAGEDATAVPGFVDTVRKIRGDSGLADSGTFSDIGKSTQEPVLEFVGGQESQELGVEISDSEILSIEEMARVGELPAVDAAIINEASSLSELAEKADIAYREAVKCVV